MRPAPDRSRGRRATAESGGGRGSRRRLFVGTLALLLAAGASVASIELAPDGPGRETVAVGAARQGDPGAALRGALAAAAAGDHAEAEELLAAVAARYDVIADYADLLRLRMRVEAGDFEAAVALATAWRHAGSPLESERQELLGWALAEQGDATGARSAWAKASAETGDAARQAALQLARAESFAAVGDVDSAIAAYLVVWTRHPLAPEAERATAALGAIAQSRGTDPRTGADFRRRADTLYHERHNEDALTALDSALAFDDLGTSDRRRALTKRAQTLFRLRRYPEAVAAFDRLPRVIEYRIERARALARSGDPLQGARDLEIIGRAGRGVDAMRALFLAGLLWDGEGEGARARGLFEEVVRVGAGTSFANAALWRFGWAAFRDRRLDEARETFERLVEQEEIGVEGLRTRYWLARTLEEAGEFGAAQSAFAAIAAEFPISYYGWRAGLRTGSPRRSHPPEAISDGKAVLTAAELSRARILLEAGLDAEARRELDRLYSRAQSLGDRLGLSNLYASSGDFHQAQSLIVTRYAETLARGPVPAQLELWWHAWPAPYAEDMRFATANGDRIEPGLVYALMREESGYRPAVISVSGARGLLQIMPETGERLAREISLDGYRVDDLFLPNVNLRLGSHYLTTLLELFDGQKSAAIASYNAGPTAVSRWLDPALEDDEWVESIPYDQTRAYVQRVLRSLYAYQVLY
jgi:soluble lytic murein transglycosylase